MSIKETVEQLVTDLLDDIRRNHEAAGQKVTGKTISSLESSVLDEGEGSLRVQVSGFSYMGVLDTGAQPARRKGTDEEREEMIKNLTEWCRMRGVPESGLTEDKYRQFAKYLKWRINKFGTRLYYEKDRQNKVIAPAVERFEERLAEQLSVYYEWEVMNAFHARSQNGGFRQ